MISIVVTFYNVGVYLKQYVNSILNHTFTDYEIVLVDDGSGFDTIYICDLFAQTDKRIKVYHKENGGLSDARI